MKLSFIASYSLCALALSFPALSSASVIMTSGGTAVTNEGVATSQTGVTTVNFDSGIAPSNFTLTGGAGIVSGTTQNYVAPTGDTSDYLTTNTGSVTINLSAAPINYFGLDWSTLDGYNTLALTESNGTVDTYTGAQAASIAGVPSNGTTSAYINFLASPGTTWKSVTMTSTSLAFESDNIAYGNVAATPEPATWSLVAGGLSVAGLLFRRRNKLAA